MKVVSLFCGCGGLDLAFQQAGHEIVWECDIDHAACFIYYQNFGTYPAGDITKIPSRYIPDHDILTGGFPCQPFSSLGEGKGFADPRGQLYRQIVRILKAKRPWAFFLENVPKLASFPGFARIEKDIRKLGYSFSWRIIDSALVWPQSRKRLFMVGYRDGHEHEWPTIAQMPFLDARTLLEAAPEVRRPGKHHWQWLVARRARGESGAWGYRWLGAICPTLSCGEADRIFVDDGKRPPRYLTIRERARIQGFPDGFSFDGVSRTAAVSMIGNAVCIPLIKILAESLHEKGG